MNEEQKIINIELVEQFEKFQDFFTDFVDFVFKNFREMEFNNPLSRKKYHNFLLLLQRNLDLLYKFQSNYNFTIKFYNQIFDNEKTLLVSQTPFYNCLLNSQVVFKEFIKKLNELLTKYDFKECKNELENYINELIYYYVSENDKEKEKELYNEIKEIKTVKGGD